MSAINDGHFLFGFAVSTSEGVHFVDNLLSINNLSEDDMLAVKPGAGDKGDEELGAVGVFAGVGHGEEVGFGVLDLEVLVLKLFSVDGLAPGSVSFGEVTSLGHELGDDSVEAGSLVAETFFTSAECSEVLSGFGDDISVEFEDDFFGRAATEGDIEENFGSGHVDSN